MVQICKELGQPYDEYAGQLKRLERAQEAMPDFNMDYEKNNRMQPELEEREEENITVNIEKKNQR